MKLVAHGIDGVSSVHLTSHEDDRGCLTEIYRELWYDQAAFIQWNVVISRMNTLRGVQVHFRHYDYLLVISGLMRLGLRDVRPDSRTSGKHDVLSLDGNFPTVWIIPPGVAHCFSFPVASTLLVGVSHYWDKADEIVCRWDDPGLGFVLTNETPILSPRDANAGSLAEMIQQYQAALAGND